MNLTQNEYAILLSLGCTLAGALATLAVFTCFFTCTMKRGEKSSIKTEFETSNCSIFSSQSALSNISKESNGGKKLGKSGDRKLAQSAQLFHYQLQKQQIIDLEKANGDSKSEADSSDNETYEGDYTIYECPGLARVGVVEVVNPLYAEEFAQENKPTFSTFKVITETDLNNNEDKPKR